MSVKYNICIISLINIFTAGFVSAQESIPAAPPDQPAVVHITERHIEITYRQQVIFSGEMNADSKAVDIRQIVGREGDAVSQVIKFTSLSSAPVVIKGNILASDESFPCAADRPMVATKDIVRSSVGLSHSLLNRAVYDRKWDWVLSVDYFSTVVIDPAPRGPSQNSYQISMSGDEISIRFRPRYYQFHRGLKYYEPWTYRVWNRPVAGWSSWFAYGPDITEQKIKKVADVISEKLHPYGYDYIQMDDGYEQNPIGFPDTWLHPNDKFPSGLGSLAAYIKAKGLIPGIWTNVTFHDRAGAFAHKDLFVLNEKGAPASGQWIGYPVDGSNPTAIDKIIRPVYYRLDNMGWQYFKVDALRHLRYEGYNSYSDYFAKKYTDRVSAYRNVLKAIREEVGKNNFILGCWGIRPELIGLIDACRIGDDGYSWQEMAQYNSFNNLVWRNDPDHIRLNQKYAFRDCMVASMTGSLLMLSDPAEVYDTGNVAPAVRTAPVLFTLPGQLYDVDPSRSMYLSRVNTEMSGSGPRVFDASRSTPYDLFLLEINEPYENWMLLGRVGESRKYISFNELGLDAKKTYLVFEFWSKSFRGTYIGGFEPGAINTAYHCQLFCIRALQDHPQLMATNRHISCGALELSHLQWNNHTLSGSSKVIAGDEYVIYIHELSPFHYEGVECTGAKVAGISKKGDIREVKLVTDKTGVINWAVIYQ